MVELQGHCMDCIFGFPCNPKVQEYHKKLVNTQYLLTAISLAKGLQGRLREDEVIRIILNLLYLFERAPPAASLRI